MDKKIKEFIEKYANLIEDNQWEEIYKRLEYSSIGSTGIFTESLLDAGINPLDYLNYIPDFYLLNSSIEKFKIPNNVKIIGSNAFYLCESLKDITIPDSVISIGNYAFGNCSSLTNIEIPDSVTSIGNRAFFGCYNLTSIAFKGTIEQWNSISKSISWNYNVPTDVIKCTDGDKRYEP